MNKTKTLLILLFLGNQMLFAQVQLPVIRASSKNVIIMEGADKEQSAWWISPDIKPDVHVINKSPEAAWVQFCTDMDTLKTKLKPGQKFDFIVLLNGKDSCYTRLESKAPVMKYRHQVPEIHDTIPFVLTEYNNIKIKACLNRKDTLFLKFDSGATGLLLTREAIVQKTSLLPKKEGENKPNYDEMPPFNTLAWGKLVWDSLSVYPVELSGQGTDGRFGWDLFDGMVVEIDYDKCVFIVHSTLPKIAKGWSKLPIVYSHSLFCIEGTLHIKEKKYKNRFLFDSGYQRTIMLDSSLMARQNTPTDLKVIKKTIMQNGQGKAFSVVTVNIEKLQIARNRLLNIPAQKLTTSNPAGFPVHILGNEVLKRFNTILDFQQNKVYLQPNKWWNLPYTDAS